MAGMVNSHSNATPRIPTTPLTLTSSPLLEVVAEPEIPRLGAEDRKEQEYGNNLVSFRSPGRAAGRDSVSGPSDRFSFELVFRRPQETEVP